MKATNGVEPASAAGTAMSQNSGTSKRPSVGAAITKGARPAPYTRSSASRKKSATLEKPSTDSIEPFARPIDARQLAGQINTVATGLLNGEYVGQQLDTVRLYAAMVRSIAQLMTAETSRARQSRELPDLTLPELDVE